MALFIEPIQFCERRYRQKLEGALKLIPNNGSDVSIDKQNDIWTRIVALNTSARAARKDAIWPMWLIKVGAAINFIILLLATVVPEGELSVGWTCTLLGSCIVPIVLGYIWISLIAKFKIAKLEATFR